ncbi:MAG TPA: FAD:protein FMN transferase [Jatrophihabitans sp.]|jgi:thiamine biosynthesis lipoprotein|nr:FAD:protein FMN transferase [Jatrophihabitans sp.]
MPQPWRHHYEVMGTVFSFVGRPPLDRGAIPAVERELDRIDRVFSTYRPNSEISALAAGERTLASCADEVRQVLALCAEASVRSHGYFSALHSGRLDPTGLVKGWAVARVSQILTAAGSTGHVVNGGGDILAVGRPAADAPWRIGVTDGSTGAIVATVREHNIAVATSGNSERPGLIVDPFTGRPALGLRSVTVIGADIVLADAFATAAVAMGGRARAWLEDLPGHHAVVIAADGTVSLTGAATDVVRTADRVRPGAT